MSEKRNKKALVAFTTNEHRLARLVAERLGYKTGERFNVATAAREELLKQATLEELELVDSGEPLAALGEA